VSVTADAETSTRRTPRFHTLTVTAVDRLCEDAAALTFAVPEELSEAYAFVPGESLTLRRVVDGVEQRRSYSICAPAGCPPRIGVRRIPDGLFSAWLVDGVAPGERIEVQTPSGSFRADPLLGGRHLCIAAGSGITPVLSVAASLLRAEGSAAEVTLIYGNRTSRSVMFTEELGDLKNRFGPRFQVVHVLSREHRDVDLFSGRLDADRLRRLLTGLVPLAAMDHVWLCGPFAMLQDARAVLQQLDYPTDRVHFELFYVDEPPPAPIRPGAPALADGCELTVVMDGLLSTVTTTGDRSVLDAAQETRPDLPFACKGGVCGTCRALLREGEVDLRRNYALEQAELDAGFVLTCQSYPVSGRVVVDYDA
jgi:ring-1,2-phenylacetyl-CoA epoxidase subunit PaaE